MHFDLSSSWRHKTYSKFESGERHLLKIWIKTRVKYDNVIYSSNSGKTLQENNNLFHPRHYFPDFVLWHTCNLSSWPKLSKVGEFKEDFLFREKTVFLFWNTLYDRHYKYKGETMTNANVRQRQIQRWATQQRPPPVINCSFQAAAKGSNSSPTQLGTR